MKQFGGQALFLDRSDINTDEIIPAKYLTENTKMDLKPYVLEDLKLGGFDPQRDLAGKGVVVSRANFGCGSSREHAVWVFEVNEINTVIAESFARIFRQNMYNCGMLAIELPAADIEKLFNLGGEVNIEVDLATGKLTARGEQTAEFSFVLNDFDRRLVEAGGWLNYADQHY
ncbi:3-isopropylmalate dehydratase small subunit [Desulfurivibrio alkaliphilus]|uniref:Aconitate hydratase domain protein n=1 Tax=Desulfurivibrio alkaliphilus (strain DSM 19089 / UNIQEM U267 / AHT2) TaxID=589865 RepID=D6Z0K8_DESAT|nr:3-isopropylmalate dehydratase small subunit [Desulfurivibrio alkaliphilus]ADH85237.1 aconitate hydratase domain protein [Desulfurivibrio alkaliphilus AHT 2]